MIYDLKLFRVTKGALISGQIFARPQQTSSAPTPGIVQCPSPIFSRWKSISKTLKKVLKGHESTFPIDVMRFLEVKSTGFGVLKGHKGFIRGHVYLSQLEHQKSIGVTVALILKCAMHVLDHVIQVLIINYIKHQL